MIRTASMIARLGMFPLGQLQGQDQGLSPAPGFSVSDAPPLPPGAIPLPFSGAPTPGGITGPSGFPGGGGLPDAGGLPGLGAMPGAARPYDDGRKTQKLMLGIDMIMKF